MSKACQFPRAPGCGRSASEPTFFELGTEKFTEIEGTSSGCNIQTNDVLEQDGDVVTIQIEQVINSQIEEGTAKYNLDVSDGLLTITVIESDFSSVDGGEEATASSVDGDPRELAGC